MGVWVCGCVGVWVCGCVGVWVCGCVGVWVCGCVGVWVGVYKQDGVLAHGLSVVWRFLISTFGNRRHSFSKCGFAFT